MAITGKDISDVAGNTFSSYSCKKKIGLDDLGIKEILKMMLALLIPAVALPPIPPALIMAGAQLRPGLSPRKIAANIISRQHEAGIPQGEMEDGSTNPTEKMWEIASQELVKDIQENGVVSIPYFGPDGTLLLAKGIMS